MKIEDIINHVRNRPYMSGVERSEQRKGSSDEGAEAPSAEAGGRCAETLQDDVGGGVDEQNG